MIVAISIAVFLILYILTGYILLTRENPLLFKGAVKRYAKKDQVNMPAPGSIISTGSSIMKYWKNIENDLSPLPVFNRAIGGTKISEINYWADSLITQYKPGAVLLYAGSNDIQGPKPASAHQVSEGFKTFVEKVRKENKDLPVFYISITPTPSRMRWKHWNIVKEANTQIKEYCQSENELYFIDITDNFLNERGKPILEYFKFDKIHMNEKGYSIWTKAVKPFFEDWYKKETRK